MRYQTQEMQLPPVVAQGEKPVLLGRNWLEKCRETAWISPPSLYQVPALEDILAEYEAQFEKRYRHIRPY